MLIEAPLKTGAITYPESDGKPMAETGIHVLIMAYLIGILRAFFRHRSDVYVSGNMFMYYEEGNPKKVVAPDVFIAFGVKNANVERRSWFVWKEGKAPDVIFELTSGSTRQEDVEFKRDLYERLGVREYLLYDPLGDYLDPALQGYRLAGAKFRPIQMERGELISQLLGLALRAAGEELHLFDHATGTRILPPPELAEANLKLSARLDEAIADRREVEAARQSAEVRAEQAEAELARLRAELARLKGESPE